MIQQSPCGPVQSRMGIAALHPCLPSFSLNPPVFQCFAQSPSDMGVGVPVSHLRAGELEQAWMMVIEETYLSSLATVQQSPVFSLSPDRRGSLHFPLHFFLQCCLCSFQPSFGADAHCTSVTFSMMMVIVTERGFDSEVVCGMLPHPPNSTSEWWTAVPRGTIGTANTGRTEPAMRMRVEIRMEDSTATVGERTSLCEDGHFARYLCQMPRKATWLAFF